MDFVILTDSVTDFVAFEGLIGAIRRTAFYITVASRLTTGENFTIQQDKILGPQEIFQPSGLFRYFQPIV